MKFRIEIDCDNAAFGDGELMYEVADVLTTIAGRISRFECGVDHPMAIFDRNGNRIGTADFLIDPERLS